MEAFVLGSSGESPSLLPREVKLRGETNWGGMLFQYPIVVNLRIGHFVGKLK
jgi:hypothetical protein